MLSPTLFLLHINDMLQISSIRCYADDSTGDAYYTGRANISRENVIENRNRLVSEIETSLRRISDHPTKTQVCVFTVKKLPLFVLPQFQSIPL